MFVDRGCLWEPPTTYPKGGCCSSIVVLTSSLTQSHFARSSKACLAYVKRSVWSLHAGDRAADKFYFPAVLRFAWSPVA